MIVYLFPNMIVSRFVFPELILNVRNGFLPLWPLQIYLGYALRQTCSSSTIFDVPYLHLHVGWALGAGKFGMWRPLTQRSGNPAVGTFQTVLFIDM